MKNYLLLFTLAVLMIFTSCKEEEEPVNPLVGIWELDDATLEFSGFSYYGFEGDNNVYGEDSYIIEFRKDFTYERELEDIPGLGDIGDEGEWESDGEDLDLDTNDDDYPIGYSFTIVELDDRSLLLEYNGETVLLFPDNKIEEWFDDGTINSSGTFDVTDEQYDSLLTNFAVQAQGKYTLEFDKQ
ncbi:MAG: hypothetical protein RJQ14_08430 [Marinoscillum sp.]